MIITTDAAMPVVQLLSNGRYHVMVTSAGGGYSRWKDLAITRWREDATCDNWGAFCYIRDAASGDSLVHRLSADAAASGHYEAVFSNGRAVFRRRDHDIETHTEIAVSPEDDVELRRVRITNASPTRRTFDVTSYAEIVLAPPATDAAHPAFSKLFVETELLHERQAILCTRRPRAPDEPTPWMFHLLTAPRGARGASLMRRIACASSVAAAPLLIRGRWTTTRHCRGARAPCSIRWPRSAVASRSIRAKPQPIDLISGISETREACVGLVGEIPGSADSDRVLAAAPTHAQAILRRSMPAKRMRDSMHALRVPSSTPTLRCAPTRAFSARIARASPVYGATLFPAICRSCCCGLQTPANIDLARHLVQAHAYWRLHGLAVDLVILSEDRDGHQPALHEQIMKLIVACGDADRIDQPGGIFVRPADKVSEGTAFFYKPLPASSSATPTGARAATRTTLRNADLDPQPAQLHAAAPPESAATESPAGHPSAT